MSYDLTLCLNLKNKAVTQYQNYEFNSRAVVGDTEFGASDSGFKILDGDNTKDENEVIDWKVVLGFHNFVSTNNKRLRTIYANIQSDGFVTATVDTEQGEPAGYQMKAPVLSNDFPAPHVANINRTHKGKLYKITLENKGNAYAFIESVDAVFIVLNSHVSGVL